MNAIVIEHVLIAELPPAWQAKLSNAPTDTRVTVRIEEESQPLPAQSLPKNSAEANPLFGMWRDREDMADVAVYVRSVRASRFNEDGSRRKD